MLNISVFTVVLIIMIVHTLLTHLLNWWIREDDDNGIAIVFIIIEFGLALLWLYYTIEQVMI